MICVQIDKPQIDILNNTFHRQLTQDSRSKEDALQKELKVLQDKLKSEIRSLQTKLNETEERLKGNRLERVNWNSVL